MLVKGGIQNQKQNKNLQLQDKIRIFGTLLARTRSSTWLNNSNNKNNQQENKTATHHTESEFITQEPIRTVFIF